MGIAEDIVVEHQRIADTLLEVGSEAPAGVAAWTASDLAAHLLSQTAAGGLVVFIARSLVARGVRIGDRAAAATERTIRYYRRPGFDRAIDRLRGGPPRILLRPNVAPVSLFEVWLHHDDVRRANGLEGPNEAASLAQAVAFAVRYQRRALATTEVDWSLSNGDLVRWLAGRPSPNPPHDPPLRF
jgi:uncharacterized protein (TIGR03083 family)